MCELSYYLAVNSKCASVLVKINAADAGNHLSLLNLGTMAADS